MKYALVGEPVCTQSAPDQFRPLAGLRSCTARNATPGAPPEPASTGIAIVCAGCSRVEGSGRRLERAGPAFVDLRAIRDPFHLE